MKQRQVSDARKLQSVMELKKSEAVHKRWKSFIEKLPVKMGLKIMDGDLITSEGKKVYYR